MRSLKQERDPKRVSLGRRERIEQLIQPVVKQIAEACEGEPRLGCCGPRLEDAVAGLPGRVYARLPERCLADAGVSGEDERSRAAPDRLEKVVQRVELFLTADNVGLGRGRHLPGAC